MSDDPAGESGSESGAWTSDSDDEGSESRTNDPAKGETESGNGLLSSDRERVVTAITYATLVVLLLVALGAFVGFYSSVGRVIDLWVTDRYRPVFRAAFNLVALLLAGAGISLVLRRLR